jgi:hypothetical protein
MRYEFNVLKLESNGHYVFLFGTSERSALDYKSARALYKELSDAFPEPLYNITCIKWPVEGFAVDIELELM